MNKYTAEPIVCDTGVFMNGELQIVCKHSKNAEIIAEIMNMDAREETADVEPVRHGHWILEAKHLFPRLRECKVYVIAKCSQCGERWHNSKSVWSESLFDYNYETETPDPITKQRIEDTKQRCLQDTKEIIKEYVSCELCGAKMDGKETEQNV